MSTPRSVAGEITFVLIFIVACSIGLNAQPQEPAHPAAQSSSQQMNMGVLAIVSDHSGTLYVDDEKKAEVVASKILILKLIAGQHFVDLRDSSGSKLWDRIVSVPSGSQIAENIQISSARRNGPAEIAPTASLLRSQVREKRFEEYGVFDLHFSIPKAEAAADDLKSLQAEGCSQEKLDNCSGLKIVFTLYGLGRYNEALGYANAIEHQQEQNAGPGSFTNITLQSLRDDFAARAYVKYAIGDNQGTLDDLNRALSDNTRSFQAESALAGNASIAFQAVANDSEATLTLCRAITLKSMRRYAEALADLDQVSTDGSNNDVANLVRAEIKLKMVSDPGVSDTIASTTSTAPQQYDTRGSGGGWTCSSAACDRASVTVHGNEFAAELVLNARFQGQSCDAIRVSPTPSDQTPPCSSTWDFAGSIEGSAIEGILTINQAGADSAGCSFPAESHKFTGAVKENGQLVELTSEKTIWNFPYHDDKSWVWQKSHYVCDPPTVAHSEPVIYLLRPLGEGISSIPMAPSTSPISSSNSGDILSQIEAVIKSGQYTTLPAAQVANSSADSQPGLFVQNQTSYQLTVLISGPITQSVMVAAGGSQSVSLPPGTYNVVAKVSAPSVLPFFGQQNFAMGSDYRENFYIQ